MNHISIIFFLIILFSILTTKPVGNLFRITSARHTRRLFYILIQITALWSISELTSMIYKNKSFLGEVRTT